MFSFCSKVTPATPSNIQHRGADSKQIKGGYLLRYRKQLLWNRWSEEFVVLYDDSTMAWYTETGRSSPAGKILVKEAPEMLAISKWTEQIPRRPPLPKGCTASQLIALGSRGKRSKVYWMLAKSEEEVSDWMTAITKTLPTPPQIELVIDKTNTTGVAKRPLVRIRPTTTKEITETKPSESQYELQQNYTVKNKATVAILKKSTNKDDSVPGGTLTCTLPWGHGWGWSTLPNGVWSGGLIWSQCEDSFMLHALPTIHCSNVIETTSYGYYHPDIRAFDFHTGIEDVGGEDFDYAMDCGDFLF